MNRTLAAAILALGMTSVTVDIAGAQGTGSPGQGPGYGPGYSGGQGMMGGYGWGPGMGGYGGGPGGGWGPRGGGPGGGYGPRGGGGPGFGGGPLAALNLTDEQSQKIAALQEENRRRNWEVMGQVRSEQFKLRQIVSSDSPDPAAVVAQQQKVDELRRQMLKSRVESRNQVAAILTPEQRQQFRSFGPWWLEE